MSILLSFDLAERRALAGGSLSALATALRDELEPLFSGTLPIPQQKARLTRSGGRCSFDGTYLRFDPHAPHEHKCQQCHRVFMGREHDDWWAMGAQLWIAERAVQAATLNLLTDDNASGALALRILKELGNRYSSWPNQDNALGPTRPFFSTYLESIWLLNLCHAIALLEQAGVSAVDAIALDDVRDSLVRPSRDLIAGFHEGRSNRQVWNEVAILSASHILGDEGTIASRLDADRGLFDLFANGLLDDGTWYEGENYHLFAHRGLWYGVQLLRALNRPLPDPLESRYRAGFVTPFLGVLPDDTLPSRRDSQYKVSIRQWRFAEWCELGISHTLHQPQARADERLVGTLHRLYNADRSLALEPQLRHRFSTADAERNEPAGLLSRADLSWRALLMSTPSLIEGSEWSPGSVCLPRQGLAVLRRERGDVYIALEGGHTGGGHGHPDRLALTMQHKHLRWLEDPGTGSYVDPSLHWYRSTLAHAAPVIDGASQDAVPATLLAFEDRGGAGWICKRVEGVKPGVNMQRTIVSFEDYVIDVLEWDADRSVQIDLPIARGVDGIVADRWTDADAGGAGGLEDGYNFLTEVQRGVELSDATENANDCSTDPLFVHHQGDRACTALYVASAPFSRWRAMAPGVPGAQAAPIHWLRATGTKGWIAGVWSWGSEQPSIYLNDADQFPEFRARHNETEFVHTRTPEGWHIALKARHATSSIDLTYLATSVTGAETMDSPNDQASSGTDSKSTPSQRSQRDQKTPIKIPRAPNVVRIDLGKRQYARTEQTWEEADRPAAAVILSVANDALDIRIFAATGAIVVPPANAENQLDNERADINADGLELFIGPMIGAPWSASWLAVPANADENAQFPDEQLRPSRITATTPHSPTVLCDWAPIAGETPFGWAMQIRVPLSDIPIQADGTFGMELIVNERPANRVRRRGMLALSGGGFAYLRGDRAHSDDALVFTLADP